MGKETEKKNTRQAQRATTFWRERVNFIVAPFAVVVVLSLCAIPPRNLHLRDIRETMRAKLAIFHRIKLMFVERAQRSELFKLIDFCFRSSRLLLSRSLIGPDNFIKTRELRIQPASNSFMFIIVMFFFIKQQLINIQRRKKNYRINKFYRNWNGEKSSRSRLPKKNGGESKTTRNNNRFCGHVWVSVLVEVFLRSSLYYFRLFFFSALCSLG